jgi:hypothetical protein
MQFKQAILVLSLALSSTQPVAAYAGSETEDVQDFETQERQTDPWNDMSQCYALDWSYDSPDYAVERQTFPDGDYYDPWNGGQFLWYCQARPLEAAEFSFPSYQAYVRELDIARDHALLRCERDADRCVTRCALAPRACRPHFWP